MIDISIASDFPDRSIDVRLACLACAVDVGAGGGALEDALNAAIDDAAREISVTPIAEWPAIAATRRAYKALGKDPSRYRPSAEALLRRVKQGKGLYRVNNVIDVNNLISVRTGFSIGTYTENRIAPPVILRPAGDGETYEGIGKGPINLTGLPVLSDSGGPFGSPTSDSERTAVGAASRRIVMVLFGFASPANLDAALDLARRELETHAAARDIETAIL
jgi:DNA/RNA-binding domain of Phe-tRNA-synthetase-like protein